MNIEIHKPEIEQRVLQSGRYRNVDQLPTSTLDENAGPTSPEVAALRRRNLVELPLSQSGALYP